MSIRPVDIATLQRINEVSQIKQNEISKPMVDQQNYQSQFTKETQAKSEQVKKKDDTEGDQRKLDAKDKGDNSYFGQSGNKKNKKEAEQTSHVSIKKEHEGFDVSI